MSKVTKLYYGFIIPKNKCVKKPVCYHLDLVFKLVLVDSSGELVIIWAKDEEISFSDIWSSSQL
jgi:hypothetical protein